VKAGKREEGRGKREEGGMMQGIAKSSAGWMDAAVADKVRAAKVTDGAKQFEAMLLEQMLKPLQFGMAPGDADEAQSGGANGSLAGYATEALAKGIVQGGGFGLARQIERQVNAEEQRKQSGVVSRNGTQGQSGTGDKV
jgi:flagellar protein FlgJ